MYGRLVHSYRFAESAVQMMITGNDSCLSSALSVELERIYLIEDELSIPVKSRIFSCRKFSRLPLCMGVTS